MQKVGIYLNLSLLLSSFCFSLHAVHYTFPTKDLKNEIVCEQVTNIKSPEELKEAEDLFVNAFMALYKDTLCKEIGEEATRTFLKEKAFAPEVDCLIHNKEGIQFFLAKLNGKLAGVATFNKTDNPHEVYFREMAVNPEFRFIGVGRALTFLCLQHYPDTTRITVACRHVNTEAIAFYKKLNFKQTQEVPYNYDPVKYAGLAYERE